MELVFNLPYRPDLMGVERTWAVAKRHYRKFVGSLRPYSFLSHRWDPVAAVQGCMEQVPDAEAQKHAELGWRALEAAQPVVPRYPLRGPALFEFGYGFPHSEGGESEQSEMEEEKQVD